MIKSFSLSRVLFVFLMFAAVVAATALLITKKNEYPSVFTLGNVDLPVLEIDAGHGGEDGGAVSLTGVHESVINLDIAQKLSAIAELAGLPYTMTRDSEEIKYPDSAKTIASKKVFDQKRRAEIINNTPNAVLISIHQNFFPHKSARGPQSFYAKTPGSDSLAQFVQGTMNTALFPGNRRVAAPIAQNIYLLKNVSCPAVLVECGFISNAEEARLLETDKYRLRIALALTSAYQQYLDEKNEVQK
ncbi:MAG: N-acetylmuramoyl-L-alanine amidase [Clostridiales bacterium]|nr:N-acetylmuramoyl-L-alanine amidase [Clostridiales bacterium]